MAIFIEPDGQVQMMPSAFALADKPVRDVLPRIRRGLPAEMFEQVAATLGLPTTTLAEKLGIARRTLTRKIGAGEPLSPDASEKLLRVARVRNLAREIFTTDEAVARWLLEPDTALDDTAPVELLDTDVGAREVEHVLRSLAYGQFP